MNCVRDCVAYCILMLAGGLSTALAQDFMPNGVIITRGHVAYLNDHDQGSSFVSVRFSDEDVFLCTTGHEFNGESKVGLEFADGLHWAPFVGLVDGGEELVEDEDKFNLKHRAIVLAFYPLKSDEPIDKDARVLWQELRKRSVDLNEAAKDLSIPANAEVFSYKLRRHEGTIVKRQQTIGMLNATKSVINNGLEAETIYHFRTDVKELKTDQLGAPVFRHIPKDSEDVSKEFLGITLLNSGSTDDNLFVVSHPLSVKLLFKLKYRLLAKANR